MSSDGYNPLRWNCDEKGCYNKKARPRIEEFSECFPGKGAMGDIDGAVEINSHLLLLEWKSDGGALKRGQTLMYERITRLSPKITVIVVHGHPRDMAIETVQVWKNGAADFRKPSNLAKLKRRMKDWADRAKSA